MIKNTLLATTLASGLIVPAQAGVYLPPKPAIVKPENIEFSKNLLAMPITLGMLKHNRATNSPTVTYIGNNIDTTTTTSYTFTAQGIGTASTDRYVVVGISTASAGAATLTSITIGGTAATVLTQSTYQSNVRTALAHLLVTSGTTADIVVTTSGTVACMGIAVWNVKGGFTGTTVQNNSTTVDDSGTVFTVTHPTVTSGDRIISIGRWGTTPTLAWTNATEDVEILVENNQAKLGGATSSIASNASNYVVTATLTGGNSTVRLSSVRYYA